MDGSVRSNRTLFDNRGDVQAGDVSVTVVIGKNHYVAASWMNRGVVGSGHRIFPAIAGSNQEWLKGRAVQQFLNSRNHGAIIEYR